MQAQKNCRVATAGYFVGRESRAYTWQLFAFAFGKLSLCINCLGVFLEARFVSLLSYSLLSLRNSCSVLLQTFTDVREVFVSL